MSAGETEKEGIVKAKDALVSSQANIIGTVLNNFKLEKDHYSYRYYGTEE
jgi:Mrp family chromosome partitioning ATPase